MFESLKQKTLAIKQKSQGRQKIQEYDQNNINDRVSILESSIKCFLFDFPEIHVDLSKNEKTD